MSKKRFVQTVIARSLPAHDKRQAALDYALNLWEWLGSMGYGDDKPSDPRDAKDWYKSLSSRQQQYFDQFWTAFAYKKDRDGAAMRWSQLGNLLDADYQKIIQAAFQEARSELPPGQARKMAQGWLYEKRYLDHQAPEPGTLVKQYNEVAKLTADLNGLRRLYEFGKDEALLPQIAKTEEAIRTARAAAQ